MYILSILFYINVVQYNVSSRDVVHTSFYYKPLAFNAGQIRLFIAVCCLKYDLSILFYLFLHLINAISNEQ
jgi:hypothetical protein